MAKRRRTRLEHPGWSAILLNAALGALALLLVVLLLGLLASTVLLGIGTLAPWIAAGLALFLFVQVVLFRWFQLNSAADRKTGVEGPAADQETSEAGPASAGGEPDMARDETPSATDEAVDWRAWRG